MNLARLLAEKAEAHSSKIAIDFEGARITYAELFTKVRAEAARLEGLGVKPGFCVALKFPKSMELIVRHLAVLWIGAVSLPLNDRYTDSETGYFLQDSGAINKDVPLFHGCKGSGHDHECGGHGAASHCGAGKGEEKPGDCPPFSSEEKIGDCHSFPEEVAMLCYTSGTTGRPKGAMITHENLISNMESLHEAWQWSDRDVLLHALPLFHIHGLVVALHGALNAGATVIMMESFDAERVSKALEVLPCTIFMGVPTQYQRIMACWEAEGKVPDLSRMRLFVSGSAPLPDELFARFQKQTGHTILERYGMTETGMIASNPYDLSGRKAGSVGYPLRGVSLRVMAENGHVSPHGEVGEVQLKGRNVFKGYWNAPEKTADSFDHGWFRTGDLGYLDPEDGERLFLKGRAKELIISGGFNVYPREVEEQLLNHPDVEEAAVYGLPDHDLGERVAAAVVLAPSARPTGEALIASQREQLTAHLREQLTAYKRPKEIRFLDRLPRNAMGKVQKHLLPQK